MPFTEDTFAFLDALAANNNREWFDEHRQNYEVHVRQPAFALIESMVPRLYAISPSFTAVAKKSGGSLMRIFRDTRFSKDKTPYKTNIGIQFRHEAGKDVHAPGFYLHVASDECFLGVGIWRPDSESLQKIRKRIDERGEEWLAARDDAAFRHHFVLGGDSLQRPPKGYGKEHPLIGDLKRKDFIAVCEFDRALALQPDFADFIADRYTEAAPLMRFLCKGVGVSY